MIDRIQTLTVRNVSFGQRRIDDVRRPLAEQLEDRRLLANTGLTGGGQSHSVMQPSLAVHYIINREGVFPARGGDGFTAGGDAVTGEVRMFAGDTSTLPPDWLFADGTRLPIGDNESPLLGAWHGVRRGRRKQLCVAGPPRSRARARGQFARNRPRQWD